MYWVATSIPAVFNKKQSCASICHQINFRNQCNVNLTVYLKLEVSAATLWNFAVARKTGGTIAPVVNAKCKLNKIDYVYYLMGR